MLQLMAFIPVQTLNGEVKSRQLYWDFVTHRSMVNVSAKAENNSPLILKEYPGAIMGMLNEAAPISKLDAFTFPIHSVVTNDMSFMNHLIRKSEEVIREEDSRVIDIIIEKSSGEYTKEYFENLEYPVISIGTNDVRDEYKEFSNDADSIIIYRTIDFGHGVVLRSDAIHPVNRFETPDHNGNSFITQFSLLVMKDSILLNDYSIEQIQKELVPFFSDLIAWIHEFDISTSENISEFKAKPFSILKLKALTAIV